MNKRSSLLTAAVLTFASLPPARAADARLSKPVTEDVIGTDLGRLTADLTRQTGIRFRAKPDIADEKLDVFVTNYPVGKLMSHVARVFGYRWEATNDATPGYTFARDTKTRLEQERLRDFATDAAEARLRDDLNNPKKYLDMSDGDVKKLSGDEKDLASQIRSPAYAPTYRFLADLTDDERDALIGSSALTVAHDSIPPKQLQGIINALPWRALDTDTVHWSKLGPNPEDVSKVDINVPIVTLLTSNVPIYAIITVTGQNGEMAGRGYCLDPASLHGRMDAADDLDAGNTEQFRKETTELKADSRFNRKLPAMKPEPAIDASKQHGAPDSTHALLRRLAAATRVPIISDYYTTLRNTEEGEASRATDAPNVAVLLSEIKSDPKHTLRASDGALLMRTNQWPKLMRREVPLSTLDELEDAQGNSNRLNYDQSIIAARLAEECVRNLDTYNWEVTWAYDSEAAPFLRFLAALSGDQLSSAFSGAGLDLSTLPAGTADAFQAFYQARWTARGYSPQVLSLHLAKFVTSHGGFNDTEALTTLSATFHIVLPNETKDSSMQLEFGADRSSTPAADANAP